MHSQIPKLASPKILAWDLETVPDKEALQNLPDPKPRANLKDPKKIAQDIKDKKASREEKAALNPNTALIVACGVSGINSNGEVFADALVRGSEETERDFMLAIWDAIGAADIHVTFNGMGFDVPMMMRRSLFCGVMPVKQIDTYKYGIPPKGNHFDLMQIMSHYGAHPVGGLEYICRRVLAKEKYIEAASGQSNEIALLWDKGDYESIEARARRDAEITFELWDRIRGIYFNFPRPTKTVTDE